MNSIIWLPIPVTGFFSMLCMTNIVTDVVESCQEYNRGHRWQRYDCFTCFLHYFLITWTYYNSLYSYHRCHLHKCNNRHWQIVYCAQKFDKTESIKQKFYQSNWRPSESQTISNKKIIIRIPFVVNILA